MTELNKEFIAAIAKCWEWQQVVQNNTKLKPNDVDSLKEAYAIINVTEEETEETKEAMLAYVKGDQDKTEIRDGLGDQVFTVTQQSAISDISFETFQKDFIEIVKNNFTKIHRSLKEAKKTQEYYSFDTYIQEHEKGIVVRNSKTHKVLKPYNFTPVQLGKE